MNASITTLQEQVENLYASLNALRAGGDTIGFPAAQSERSMSMSQTSVAPQPVSPMSRYRPVPRHPSFRGPTSSAFSLDVAKNTLHNMGYQSLTDEGVITGEATPLASPPAIRSPFIPNGNMSQLRTRDPIWAVGKEEMIRLCRVYEEEMGIMYPVVNIEQIIQHGSNLYDFVGAALRTGLATRSSPQGVNDEKSWILKMILAISTVVEGSGQSEIAYRLFESVREPADRTLHSETIEVKSLPFLVLVVRKNFPFGLLAALLEYSEYRRGPKVKVERREISRLAWIQTAIGSD